ncbi:MAG: GPW/gp25 family protein [Proteobacteria bacterium]|nr:GPW/gp25 family protein [Pseudomonadota bacterium]
MSEYEENIRQCVSVILGTKPGERQMLPEFGCRIHELMFAPNTAATASSISYHVRRALARWEPRIEVSGVDAFPDANGHMRVTVKYTIRSTESEHDLSLMLNPGS